ncbi:hypothetical protein [Streptomyces sedi]|uniref:Uncharacterized protein n=1 Tax=Streptomyces sedi TaxID=555059 RepID=A0A5C4V8D0_9ACTN|nr:hypothetical protein [Streptomyces sedi]TNM32153.1 hypothetical protein FH715_07050 [Streptomyces sedi]
MELTRYAEKRGWNPLARAVTLTEHELRVGARRTPVGELALVAVADAWLRGVWLGGGGSERPLAGLPHGPGRLPLVRASGTALPLRVRDVAGFAAALGELAARHAGGAGAVREAARRAAAEGVPLWIARRQAPGPGGRPVTVAVDRRLVRADVWVEGAPAVRLRGPYGWSAGAGDPLAGLGVTIGERPVDMAPTWGRWGRSVTFSDGATEWELIRATRDSGRLLRDGEPVATIARPTGRPVNGLLPLADVRHRSRDPLDAALAHLCGVALGLGEATGTARFGGRHSQPSPEVPATWELPWYTGLGESRDDSGPGASGDGWSDGGGGGADGDSGGGSGGDSGGGDSGGGGGDGGGGGGGE